MADIPEMTDDHAHCIKMHTTHTHYAMFMLLCEINKQHPSTLFEWMVERAWNEHHADESTRIESQTISVPL
jgi:hypothetical protein